MTNECNIIRDLLPLYVEHLVSSDTAEFVEAHLKTCAACRKVHAHMAESDSVSISKEEMLPLQTLRKSLLRKKLQTILLTAMLVAAILVSAFAAATSPEYFPYSEGLLSVKENADQSVTITFADQVTCYRYTRCTDPDDNASLSYEIEAWDSLWDRWFANRGAQSVTLKPEGGQPFVVYYTSNNKEQNVCIYGQEPADSGSISTPRLVLGYYFAIASLALFLLTILWFLFRRRDSARIWIERIRLFPASYLLGHLIIQGTHTISYSMPRDFLYILTVSLLLSCTLLLLHGILLQRRERTD